MLAAWNRKDYTLHTAVSGAASRSWPLLHGRRERIKSSVAMKSSGADQGAVPFHHSFPVKNLRRGLERLVLWAQLLGGENYYRHLILGRCSLKRFSWLLDPLHDDPALSTRARKPGRWRRLGKVFLRRRQPLGFLHLDNPSLRLHLWWRSWGLLSSQAY